MLAAIWTTGEINARSMKFSFFKSILAVILNKNSEEAFDQVVALELYQKLLIAGLVKPFSNRGEVIWNEIAVLLPKVDAALIAQMAVYFRDNFSWPWVPQMLLIKWSGIHQGDGWVRQTAERILRQPEDILNLLACYEAENEGLQRLSKQLQKGIAASFGNLTLEQLVGLRRSKSVSLRDALLLTHPKAQNAQQEKMFKDIYEEKLPTPTQWKKEWREFKKQAFPNASLRRQAAQKHWGRWIAQGQMGLAELLRYLRTILKAGMSDETMEKLQQQLTDPAAIKDSQRLPFFFFSERMKLEKFGAQTEAIKVAEWLNKAQQQSVENLRGFADNCRALIAVDRSAEMFRKIGKKNPLRYADLGMLLVESLQGRVAQLQTRLLGTEILDDPFSDQYSQNPATMIDSLVAQKQIHDKILVFTSGSEWDSPNFEKSLAESWKKYRSQVAPQARLYLFCLLHYEQTPVQMLPDGRTLISGWSERIFEVLAELELVKEAISKIKAIKIDP